MLKTLQIIVFGKVQGVYFRQSTKMKAIELGIGGTVENMPDRQFVKIQATGQEKDLEIFVNWCHQGPPSAIVQNVEVKEVTFSLFESFKIV